MINRLIWEYNSVVKNRFTKINRKPVLVLGNQKSGTSAIANLLAIATGKSIQNDIFCWQGDLPTKLLKGDVSFERYLSKSKLYYSKDIIKEPSLTFFYEEVRKQFSPQCAIFIVRNPFDNIRSILNRLKISGTLDALGDHEYQRIGAINPDWLHIIKGDYYSHRGANYIETLALRYNGAVQMFSRYREDFTLVRYEDFTRDKTGVIMKLAHSVGVTNPAYFEDRADFQFQPKGERVESRDFFSSENFALIDRITKENRQIVGYA